MTRKTVEILVAKVVERDVAEDDDRNLPGRWQVEEEHRVKESRTDSQ